LIYVILAKLTVLSDFLFSESPIHHVQFFKGVKTVLRIQALMQF